MNDDLEAVWKDNILAFAWSIKGNHKKYKKYG
jgi:hypothetical protein